MEIDALTILAKVSFLSNLNEESLINLTKKIKQIKFKKKSIIIHEGDETSSLYFIFSGKVRIFCTDENNKEVTLAMQEAGSSFGVLSLISNVPRTATVEALEATVCGIISKTDFIYWCQDNPEVAFNLLVELSSTIQTLTEKVKHLALSSAYEITVKVLYDLAKPEDDILIIRNKPTQEALATIVGTSRETINKFIKGLTEGGYIEVKDKNIIILKKLPARF